MGSFCSSLGPRGPFTFATLTSTPFLMSWPRPLSAVYWSRRSLVKPQFSDAQMRCLHGDRGRVGVGAGAGLGVGLRVGLGLGLGSGLGLERGVKGACRGTCTWRGGAPP